MKIKSISDVITNSSSEVFCLHYPEAYNTEETIMYSVYDPSGKTIQRLTPDYKEWKALGDPLQMHGEWNGLSLRWNGRIMKHVINQKDAFGCLFFCRLKGSQVRRP